MSYHPHTPGGMLQRSFHGLCHWFHWSRWWILLVSSILAFLTSTVWFPLNFCTCTDGRFSVDLLDGSVFSRLWLRHFGTTLTGAVLI